MEAVEHFGVTDVAVVVTRYFGGVLLGTGGLVRAYSDAANAALDIAEVVTFLPAKKFRATFQYSDYDLLSKTLLAAGAEILEVDFKEDISLCAIIPEEKFEDLSTKCTDIFCGRIVFYDTQETFSGF